jgi:hypothetical protein
MEEESRGRHPCKLSNTGGNVYQDGCEIQYSLSISLKREICEHLKKIVTLSEVISPLMAL